MRLRHLVMLLPFAAALWMCGTPVNPELDGGAGGGGAAGGGSGGGAMGGGGGMSDGGCQESWVCSPWSPDAGQAYRTCFDQNVTGTTVCKPGEGPMPLPALDYNFYRCQVQPVVALNCSMIGCHGTPDRPYQVFARGRWRNHETVTMAWPGCLINTPQTFDVYDRAYATVQCWGNMALTQKEWRMNYDVHRAFAVGLAQPQDSELLQQPNVSNGSFAHAGMKFWDENAQWYRTLSTWLDGGAQATCDAGFNDHN